MNDAARTARLPVHPAHRAPVVPSNDNAVSAVCDSAATAITVLRLQAGGRVKRHRLARADRWRDVFFTVGG